MSALNRAFLAVYGWFFDDQPVQAIALSRVIFGASLLLTYLFYLPWLDWYWGPDGLRSYLYHVAPADDLLQRALWPVTALLLVSALFFTIGLFTRWSGLVLIACHLQFTRFGVMHTWGWAETIPVFIFYVAMSGADRWLSVDAWRLSRRGIAPEPVATAWALRLLQIHVAMIYVAAGGHRIDDPGWIRGEMVYEAMSNTWYSRLPLVDFQPLKPILALATWATELLELTAPVALWFRRTRRWWLVGLIALHGGLHLGASVGFWQPMMIGALLCFVDPAAVQRLHDRLLRGRLSPSGA